ncbi:MAG: HD domain-containing protein [Bacteroidales bacterium]|nr:HD domain-containing protein [Bacteroidales bacterium]
MNLKFDLVFDLIQHPYFQRLRQIKQLGLTHFVYPGAMHSRFQHSLGTTMLMDLALNVIRSKGHEITYQEEEAATVAILLHDIGHGPFSHSLEQTIIDGVSHEEISLLIMDKLNHEFNGKLDLAIKIFKNQYHKKFLNQLIAGQLDMDRLDYLKRDSFFTGVSEGVIGADRIIKMLNVCDDQLVVESKGIYSIEKFLVARRLMYWQVYFHKTVIAAECLLIKILERAKNIARHGFKLFATPPLEYFLYNAVNQEAFLSSNKVLHLFTQLDDNDIIASAKQWQFCGDRILEELTKNLLSRNLFKTEISNQPFNNKHIANLKEELAAAKGLSIQDVGYFVFTNSITNYTYKKGSINIIKNNKLTDIADASDLFDLTILSKDSRKYFLCYPKELITKN